MGTWEHPHNKKSCQFLMVIDEGCRFRVGIGSWERGFGNVGANTLGTPILFGWILMELLEVGLLRTIAVDMGFI